MAVQVSEALAERRRPCQTASMLLLLEVLVCYSCSVLEVPMTLFLYITHVVLMTAYYRKLLSAVIVLTSNSSK